MTALPFLGKWLTAAAAALLLACSPKPAEQAPQYQSTPPPGSRPVLRFAVHPLHNPQLLAHAYQPMIDLLNAQLSAVQIELEASRDYQAFEDKYAQRGPAFLLPNPWQTLQAMRHGYRVIAMAGDPADFKGLFIVRKDSGIRSPADLRGKTVSYPSHTALAAAIMPQYFLHSQGLNVRQDTRSLYVGSQESAIMNVFLGHSAAGATWPPPWRLFQKSHPREAAELVQIWQTPHLVNNSVMVRDDVPPELARQVQAALLALSHTADGQAALLQMQTAAFHPAEDSSYQVVAQYVQRFEREVRPVQQP